MSTHILSGWTEYPKTYFPKTKSLSGFNSDRINCTNELSPPCRNKQVKPISSTHKYIERGKTDILNTQIHRKR
jgi:hypothetical protein